MASHGMARLTDEAKPGKESGRLPPLALTVHLYGQTFKATYSIWSPTTSFINVDIMAFDFPVDGSISNIMVSVWSESGYKLRTGFFVRTGDEGCFTETNRGRSIQPPLNNGRCTAVGSLPHA
jgi:hypothetical protein